MPVGGFSLIELFWSAHPVVKGVMVGLLLASVWAWAIIIEKLVAFRRARRFVFRLTSVSIERHWPPSCRRRR